MEEKKKKIQKTIKDQGRIRTWFQVAWFVLTNGYIRGYTKGMIYTGPTKSVCLPGLNCYSCPGALGSCPMGSLQAVLGDTSYRVSLYVFGTMAAMGVIFGRLICSWMCPFGLFQDLLYKIRVKGKKKNLPGHKYLKYLRYVILIVFPLTLTSLMLDVTGASMPWFCEWICPSGMLLGGLPLVAVNEGIRSAAGFRFAWKLFILLACTAIAIWYYRPFCKYICPLGAIYGLCNPVASYRLVIDRDKCVSCGSCQRSCGMDIRTFEKPNSPDCIRCGSCMRACPMNAIESTWGRTGKKLRARYIAEEAQPLPQADLPEGPAADTALTAPGAVNAVDPTAAPGLIPQKGKATFLGIIMIFGALEGIVSSVVLGLYSGFDSRLLVSSTADLPPGDWLLETFWLAASVLVLVTGIYTLRHRATPDRLIYLPEKMKAAGILVLVGVICFIVCCIIDPNVLGLILTYMILGFYPLIAVPALHILTRLLRRRLRGQRQSGFVWVVMSALGTLITISPLALYIIFSIK